VVSLLVLAAACADSPAPGAGAAEARATVLPQTPPLLSGSAAEGAPLVATTHAEPEPGIDEDGLSPHVIGPGRWAFEGVRVLDMKPRRVTVVVPPGYERAPHRRFPVLYAWDGQSALEGGLDLAGGVARLAERHAIEPWIVVTIDATSDRTGELTTRLAGSRRLLFDVVKPRVDAAFWTRPGPTDTAVVGYSYGGLATLRLALSHGALFERAICMSPSLWWADGRALRELDRHATRWPRKLWIDVGLAEGPAGERDGMVVDARAARGIARARGMTLGRDLGYWEEPGAPHGHAAGGRRIDRALAFGLAP